MEFNSDFELTIATYLLISKKYFSKVIPFVRSSIFLDDGLAEFISYYVKATGRDKHLKLSDIVEKIKLDTSLSKSSKERLKQTLKRIYQKIKEIKELHTLGQTADIDSLIKDTEKYFKTRLIENAIIKAAQRLQEKKEISLKELEDALGFSFDSDLGIYYRDIEKRLQYYSENEIFYELPSKTFNELLGGGLTKKSLYVFTGKTNIGKSLLLCSLTVDLVKSGYNVVYISGELTEGMILQRIDANVYDIPISDLKSKSKEELKEIFLSKNFEGDLFIKDFPASSVNTAQIKSYLEDLKLKHSFKPDFIVVDYMTLFLSSRLPASAMRDLYTYYKCVAEEFRAIGHEYDAGIITATQLNREGAKKKKITGVDTVHIAESFGVAFTADFQGILFQNDALREQNTLIIKVVKTRFSDNNNEAYPFYVDYKKMRISDHENITDDITAEVEKLKLEDYEADEKPDLDFEEI